MFGQNGRKYSLNDLLLMEEMRAKLQRLNSMHQTTNAMIVSFDLHPKSNLKRKVSNQQKSLHSMAKKRTLQPLVHRNSSTDRRKSQRKLSINTDLKSVRR